MVVVFDSDVLIPLILPASRSTHLLDRLRVAGHRVAASPAILDEVASKLRTKASLRKWLGLADEEIEEFLTLLPVLLVVVPGIVHLEGAVPDDPNDDKIIAAAVESQASYLVSGDHHLLALREWNGIKIMNRVEFDGEFDRLERDQAG
ncbi:MAG TPA: putative toxin-antitoxin system toxin component, PIN family [Pirellulales bacterium]|jgi:putative PIN family toxin of toxin-antitoxin system|nr:putative toxin-antitoxin system toxin component, PIN family [Pirellulales bacterium]